MEWQQEPGCLRIVQSGRRFKQSGYRHDGLLRYATEGHLGHAHHASAEPGFSPGPDRFHTATNVHPQGERRLQHHGRTSSEGARAIPEFSEAADTATRTSPGPGSGTATSAMPIASEGRPCVRT